MTGKSFLFSTSSRAFREEILQKRNPPGKKSSREENPLEKKASGSNVIYRYSRENEPR
jgi:hypothetical protein